MAASKLPSAAGRRSAAPLTICSGTGAALALRRASCRKCGSGSHREDPGDLHGVVR
jgi:ribosomal protein L40E